jgi:hypothetical protein
MKLKREASTRSALAQTVDDDDSSTSSIYTSCDPLRDPEAGDRVRSRRELMAGTRELSSSSSLSLSQRSLRTMTRINELVDSPTSEASTPSGRLWGESRAARDYEDHNIYLNDVSEDASESSILDYFITAAEAGRSKEFDYKDTDTDETEYTDFTRQTYVDGGSKRSVRPNSDRSRSVRHFPRLLCKCTTFLLAMVVIVGINLLVGELLPQLRQLFAGAGAEGFVHAPNETAVSDPVTTLPEPNVASTYPEPQHPGPHPYFGEVGNATANVGPSPAPSSTWLSSSNSSFSTTPESDPAESETQETTSSSACVDSDESFWFQMIDETPTVRTCEWLRDQSELLRSAWCGDGASYAFINCPLTCRAC